MRFLIAIVMIPIVSTTTEEKLVTCRSLIKLMNTQDGSRLHSHDVKYGDGSGQQSVTGVKIQDDINSHWMIHPGLNEECGRGEPLKCGQKIRLRHLTTGCFLHSHHFTAPLSSSFQEVSCFGDEEHSDSGDNWQLICTDDEWLEDESVKLKHVDTGAYLAVTGKQFGRPISGQREVAGAGGVTSGAQWKAAEGVYMTKSKDL